MPVLERFSCPIRDWFASRVAAPIDIETIDGGAASASPHAPALLAFGFKKDRSRLCLERAF